MSLDPDNAGVADDLDDAAEPYPLEGEARFRRLPLRLPPGFTFYLGTHQPAWLETATVPLFLSRRRLVLHEAGARSGFAATTAGTSLQAILRALAPGDRREAERAFEVLFAHALYELCRAAAVTEGDVSPEPPEVLHLFA